MRKILILSATALLAVGLSFAQTTNFDMAGVTTGTGGGGTEDQLGQGTNTIHTANVNPDTFVNGLAWTAVDGSTVGASWGQEAAGWLSANPGTTTWLTLNTAGTAIELGPGATGIFFRFFSQGSPCTPCGPVSASFTSATQTAILPMPISANNIYVEIFETYNDASSIADFSFSGGTVTLSHSQLPVELKKFRIE